MIASSTPLVIRVRNQRSTSSQCASTVSTKSFEGLQAGPADAVASIVEVGGGLGRRELPEVVELKLELVGPSRAPVAAAEIGEVSLLGRFSQT